MVNATISCLVWKHEQVQTMLETTQFNLQFALFCRKNSNAGGTTLFACFKDWVISGVFLQPLELLKSIQKALL